MLARIGKFFIFIGILLILLFIYTDSVGSPYWGYVLLGLPFVLIGMVMRWMTPRPPPVESGRFRMLKKKEVKRKPEE